MTPVPAPPADNSGGYMVTRYYNATDSHKMKTHVRAFGLDGTFTAPSASGNTTVMAEWTAFMAFVKPFYGPSWNFVLDSIYRNNGDGTFTEIFGWAAPAVITGASTAPETPADMSRAAETIFNFRDGFGGRCRIILIGQGKYLLTASVPSSKGGSPTGDEFQKLVDYVSTASKSNITSHGGHVLQSPAHMTYCVNRRLRRHYGYA
jgi:hypothetical protein